MVFSLLLGLHILVFLREALSGECFFCSWECLGTLVGGFDEVHTSLLVLELLTAHVRA